MKIEWTDFDREPQCAPDPRHPHGIDIAAAFAEAHPVGSACRYYPVLPGKEFKQTKIRSAPWVLGSGHVVVAVEGKSGGVSVEHLFFEEGEMPERDEQADVAMPKPENHIVPGVRLDQAASILALATRTALAQFAGDDDDRRLAMMAFFLYQITRDLRRPQNMANVLRALAADLDPDAAVVDRSLSI